MGRDETELDEARAKTDESLDAERHDSDDAHTADAVKIRRTLDDRIERDRAAADARLAKFRENVDKTLADQRSDSLNRSSAATAERSEVDEVRKAERALTDALNEEERKHIDAIVENAQKQAQTSQEQQDTLRQETDATLASERELSDLELREKGRAPDRSTNVWRRRDLLTMVANDLRGPLAVIQMNAEAIAHDTHEEPTRDAMEDVIRAAARTSRLVSDLLDAARIEAGAFVIQKRPHDLDALLDEVARSYLPLFAERHMTLELTPTLGPILVPFDHDRIVQVLSNLLANAMKFAPSSAKISLSAELRGDHVELDVHDDGPGIPGEFIARIFDPFCQLDSSARRGLGLGLYICAKIISAHGGRIWAESAPGEGVTFRFTLPLG